MFVQFGGRKCHTAWVHHLEASTTSQWNCQNGEVGVSCGGTWKEQGEFNAMSKTELAQIEDPIRNNGEGESSRGAGGQLEDSFIELCGGGKG